MIQAHGKLVVDVGNSETRCYVNLGKHRDTGRVRESFFILPNSFSEVPLDYKVPESYNATNSAVMDVDCEFNGGTIRGIFCNGELCEREFRSSAVRPSALEKKYNNVTTPLTLVRVILEAMKRASILFNTSMSNLDISWDVYLLLPPSPSELDRGSTIIEEMLSNLGTMRYIVPEVEFKFKLNKFTPVPEGFGAFIGTIYNRDMSFRRGYEYLKDGVVLIVDIGAGTSEFLIIINGEVVWDSRETVNIGGNQVIQRVRKKLRNEMDLVFPESVVFESIKTGIVMDGKAPVTIDDIVNDSKEDVARSLVNFMTSYFEESQFPIRTITDILVCGGGSMKGTNPSIDPLSKPILNYIKRLAPNIELVPTPEIPVLDPDTNVQRSEITPRLLNLEGGIVLSNMS